MVALEQAYSVVDTTQVSSGQFTSTFQSTGYEAADPATSGAMRVSLKSEDEALTQRGRDRVDSAQMALARQTTIAGWCVRKHADFVATHNFDCSSDEPGLDEDIEGLVDEWSQPEEFDIRGRLSLQDHVRLDEMGRTGRGDILIQKIDNGKVQAIEADRIRNPDNAGEEWVNGVRTDDTGRALAYGVHKRKNGRFEFERIVQARNAYHFGYFKRHDQLRGISELASGITHLRQIHNAIKYAQAKQVISQIFGIKMKRNKPKSRDIDLTGGPFVAEYGMDEDIDFMADNTPSTEFDNFLKHVIGIVMKCLDLPFNFYDASAVNFSGGRASLNLYLMSCQAKRRGVRGLLNHLTKWRLNYELSRGRLRLPRSIDLDEHLRKSCCWIPIGMQWFNPLQEAAAAEKMLEMKMTSRTELRKETHGDSWDTLYDRLEQEEIRIANSVLPSTEQHPTGGIDIELLVQRITEEVADRVREVQTAA